jgi:hypothetical protein
MEENQVVCRWGVSVRKPGSDDPPVSEGVEDDESMTWYPLSRKCSVFLAAVLHHQAAWGGFPHCFSESLDSSNPSDIRFNKHKWTYYGELKGEKVYSRPNQVFCYSRFDLPIGQGWMITAGARTKRDLQAIRSELGVSAP